MENKNWKTWKANQIIILPKLGDKQQEHMNDTKKDMLESKQINLYVFYVEVPPTDASRLFNPSIVNFSIKSCLGSDFVYLNNLFSC